MFIVKDDVYRYKTFKRLMIKGRINKLFYISNFYINNIMININNICLEALKYINLETFK